MADVWERRPPTVLAAGKFVGDGKRLEPDVPSSREFIFLVPRHTYQLVRFRAQLFAIPGSVQLSESSTPEYTKYKGDNALYGFWHVDDNSWLHELIYGRDRWVVMRYEIVDPSEPRNQATTADLRVTARFPDPTWSEEKPAEADVKRLFKDAQPSDASEPFAGAELAVEPVAEPKANESEALPTCLR